MHRGWNFFDVPGIQHEEWQWPGSSATGWWTMVEEQSYNWWLWNFLLVCNATEDEVLWLMEIGMKLSSYQLIGLKYNAWEKQEEWRTKRNFTNSCHDAEAFFFIRRLLNTPCNEVMRFSLKFIQKTNYLKLNLSFDAVRDMEITFKIRILHIRVYFPIYALEFSWLGLEFIFLY